MGWQALSVVFACALGGGLIGWRRGNVNVRRVVQLGDDTGDIDYCEWRFHRRCGTAPNTPMQDSRRSPPQSDC